MIWFVCEDFSLYNTDMFNELKNNYNLSKIIIFPEKKDVFESLSDRSKNIGFISPVYPDKVIDIPSNSSFFLTIRIKNKYAPYTDEEYKYGNKEEILSKKLGLKIYKSPLNIKNYVGAEDLVNEFKKIELLKKAGFNAKGFLIVGLPGTGKSFFAKCIAGETGRLLVELNFAKIMENEHPLEKIDDIFDFLKTVDDKLIIWIDEIEKMFKNPSSSEIMGRFLTLMNDFNSKGDILFIATANNIVELSQKNPELFRTGGRFDKIIALLPPSNDNAVKIFKYYINDFLNKLLKETAIKQLFLFIKTGKTEYTSTKFENLLKDFFNLIKKDFTGYFLIFKKTEILDDFNKKFNKILNTSIVFKKKYEKTILSVFYDLSDLEKQFILESLTKYRSKIVVQERFPYTPAEISSVAREFFINYYFNPSFLNNDYIAILKYTIESVIPLQAQMKEQISEMYSQAENFLKV